MRLVGREARGLGGTQVATSGGTMARCASAQVSFIALVGFQYL